MYYVYHGHVNADNHDIYPTHRLTWCRSEQDVVELRKAFEECDHKECQEVHFVVIRGEQMKLRPVKTVTDWELCR